MLPRSGISGAYSCTPNGRLDQSPAAGQLQSPHQLLLYAILDVEVLVEHVRAKQVGRYHTSADARWKCAKVAVEQMSVCVNRLQGRGGRRLSGARLLLSSLEQCLGQQELIGGVVELALLLVVERRQVLGLVRGGRVLDERCHRVVVVVAHALFAQVKYVH